MCDVPMVVLKRHTPIPSAEEAEHMERVLTQIADREVGENRYRIDKQPRRIPDHIHYHARRRGFWW